MRKILTFVCLLVAFWQPVLAQSTPTAEEVMDKYVAAIGGKDALMKVTDMTTNMSSDMNGNAIIVTRKQKLPIQILDGHQCERHGGDEANRR